MARVSPKAGRIRISDEDDAGQEGGEPRPPGHAWRIQPWSGAAVMASTIAPQDRREERLERQRRGDGEPADDDRREHAVDRERLDPACPLSAFRAMTRPRPGARVPPALALGNSESAAVSVTATRRRPAAGTPPLIRRMSKMMIVEPPPSSKVSASRSPSSDVETSRASGGEAEGGARHGRDGGAFHHRHRRAGRSHR